MRNTGRHVQPEGSSSRPPGSRRRGALKLGIFLALAFVLISVALRLSGPYLVSSSVVRSAIASSIAVWTGHDVSIDDVSDVRFWPTPEVTLNGIVFSRTRAGEREVLGEVQRLSAEFGLISAFMGRPDFKTFRLERPRIHVVRGADGGLDWTEEGLLSEAVRAALDGSADGGSENNSGDVEIGSVDIVDGEFTFTDAASAASLTARAVNATIDWSDLSAPLSGQASFLVDERPVSVTLETPTPLRLIGGASSRIRTSVTLPGMQAQMQGLIGLRDARVDALDINVRVGDVAQAAAAFGIRLAGTERWQTASFNAQVSNMTDEWRFEGLEFQINESRGDGILALRPRPDERPLLSGTLAVEHLELGDMLQALSIQVGDRANVPLPAMTRWIDVDIRLSADTASYGAFPLTDLGASLIAKRDSVRLVIADTRFLGGTLSARLTGSGEAFDQGADLAMNMEGINLGSLTSGLALGGGPSLKGMGSLSLNAKLLGTGWKSNIESMSGRLQISSDSGEILNFDAAGLRRLVTDRAYFQLSAAGKGSFDYEVLDVAVRFSEGSAEVERARIATEDEILELSGIVPYSRQALALTGELSDIDAQTADTPLRFFIGGAWNDPVISPIPNSPTPGQ